MKKSILLLSLCAGSMFGLAQQGSKTGLNVAPDLQFRKLTSVANPSPVKTLICQDTLRYPELKEHIIGTGNFYSFNVYNSDNESVSQTFLNSGNLTINGIEFYGAKSTSGAASVIVNAAIYNVNSSNVPTTLVGSGNVTITATTYGYQYVNFASPITVTENYAIVLTPTNANGILNFYVTDLAQGQTYDEDFLRYKSDYYPNSAGAYVSAPVLSNDAVNFPGNGSTIPAGPYNFELLAAPIVNYSINTQFTPSATTVCQGTPVTYTNTTTPMSVLGNRMSSYNTFMSHFGLATSDSTFVYDMDNNAVVWNGTTTYTHPAAGTYDVILLTLGGLYTNCTDFATQTITVNPSPAAPTVTADGPLEICGTGSVTLTSSEAAGNLWSNGETTQSISVSAAGSYTVTTTAAGCTSPASVAQVVTVTPIPATPTITYSGSVSLCEGDNVVLTSSAASGNLWSNGETTQSITISTSGTFHVSEASGGCHSGYSNTVTVTVTPLDDATFAYPTNTICEGSVNPTPTTSVAGMFSASSGLVFANATLGEIDMANTPNGTYTVTYITSGTCPNLSTQTIVISGTPDATFTYDEASYCAYGTNPSPVFGAGASAGVFSSSAGLSINSGTGAIDLAASLAGTYIVTNSIAANGTCAASSDDFEVTILALPTATVSGGGSQCGTGSVDVSIELTGTGPWDVTYSDGTTSLTETGIVASPFVIAATANGTYTVTSVTASGCSALGTGTATVVFNTNPTVTFTQVADICDNASAVTLDASPAGGTFSGSTGVSGSTFDPSGLTAGSITLTYNYTDANNCSGSATSTFTLKAAPAVSLGAFQDLCEQDASFGLTGGLPAGGTYSGTAGVTAGTFDPATAGEGSHTITYTVTENGCTADASQTIVVEDCAGIGEMANFGLEVYPNPATSVVMIKAGKDVMFSMISEDGKVVYPVSSLSMNTETQLQVSHLAKGVYFLHFNNAQGSVVQKVVVQ